MLAGESPSGMTPSSSSFGLMSGDLTIVAISFCSRSTIALGVPAGTNTPVMVSASWSLMPNSSSVGTSGNVSSRFLSVMPSARILPSLIRATELPIAPHDDRHVAAEQRLRHRSAAGERHGDEIDLEIVLELLDRQRRRGAGAGRADAVLAGLFLEQLDQVLHGLGREARIDQPGVRRAAGLGDRDQILLHVERHLVVEARVHRDAR